MHLLQERESGYLYLRIAEKGLFGNEVIDRIKELVYTNQRSLQNVNCIIYCGILRFWQIPIVMLSKEC